MLRKENRIAKQHEFDRFFGINFKKNRGVSAAGGFIIVKAFPSPRAKTRIGFIVANTIDNRATARNLIKRRLREIVRLKLPALKNYDCLIIAKPACKGKTYAELEREAIYLFRRVGLLK